MIPRYASRHTQRVMPVLSTDVENLLARIIQIKAAVIEM